MSIQPLPRVGDPAPDLDEAIAAARAVLASVDRSVPVLDPGRCRDRLLAVTALASQVAELELHALHLAEVVRAGEEAGASSTATWLALETRQTLKAAHAKARLARGMTAQPLVAEAMARGEVLPDQARVILDEVAHLPGDRTAATSRLLAEAALRSAAELRLEGRRSLRAVQVATPTAPEVASTPPVPTPQVAPAADGSVPELVLADDGFTLARGAFVVPQSVARTLLGALGRVMGPAAPPDPTSEQLGAAFCAFVERRAPSEDFPPPPPPPPSPLPATAAVPDGSASTSCEARTARVCGWGSRLRRSVVRVAGVLGRHVLRYRR